MGNIPTTFGRLLANPRARLHRRRTAAVARDQAPRSWRTSRARLRRHARGGARCGVRAGVPARAAFVRLDAVRRSHRGAPRRHERRSGTGSDDSLC